MNVVKLEVPNSIGSGAVTGELLPLIKSGEYDLAFDYYETATMFGGRSPKIALWFRVITFGDGFDVRLPRYYNVAEIKGKPCKGGNFKATRHGDFLNEYVDLFGMPHRLDRIPMSAYKNVIITGKVDTVTRRFNQKRIADGLRYSIIRELVKIKRP